MPGILYNSLGRIFGFDKTRTCATNFVLSYQKLVEEIWGESLKHLDCSPTPSCSLQLASGLWDAFYSAGGLSMPGTLQAGLAIIYSTSETNPRSDFTIPKGQELTFFWECLRYIPP